MLYFFFLPCSFLDLRLVIPEFSVIPEVFSDLPFLGSQSRLIAPPPKSIPRLKSNGWPLITCRKSYYRLILCLRHQSLIVHSRSKVIHVYSLLHDEWNTAGRLARYVYCAIVVARQVNIMIKKYLLSPMLKRNGVQKRGLQTRAINVLHCICVSGYYYYYVAV